MKVKVLGIQSVDYVSRKTGNPVKGVTLHSAFKDAQVEGESVSSIFVSDNLNPVSYTHLDVYKRQALEFPFVELT